MDQLALRVSLVEDHPVLSGLLQEFIAALPRAMNVLTDPADQYPRSSNLG